MDGEDDRGGCFHGIEKSLLGLGRLSYPPGVLGL
jgi:hypothetical protein